jgi:hypothetical protein
MRKKKTEALVGVTPNELNKCRDNFVVHKSSKKGTNSFRVTKSLLESLIETSIQIQKKPTLIITIVDGSSEYTITCQIVKKIN